MTLVEIISLAAKDLSLNLIGRCGKGAFGVVYLATDQLGRLIALKIVDKTHLGKHWEREFKGIRNYCQQVRDHGNLIEIYHVKEYPDYFCYTMEAADNLYKDEEGDEYYGADTLANRLDKGMQFSVDEMLRIAEELLSGLETLHKAGLIHRDIKPSNVIFVNGHAKLGDMGLLTRFSDSQSFAGTPEYLPPELIRQGNETPRNDTEGDLYSLGKVLYCILSGLPPSSFPEIPATILGGKTIVRLNNFLLKACSDDKSRRFISISSFRNALRSCYRTNAHGLRWLLLAGSAMLAIVITALFLILHTKHPIASNANTANNAPSTKSAAKTAIEHTANIDSSAKPATQTAIEHIANNVPSPKPAAQPPEKTGQTSGGKMPEKPEKKTPAVVDNAIPEKLPLFASASWQPPPNENWTIEWNAALEKARKEKKAIYVLNTGSDWCGWCKILHKNVLGQQEFLDMASQLVLLYLDSPQKSRLCREQALHNDFIRRSLSFGGAVPNAKLFSPDGEIYGTISGGNKTLQQYRDTLKSLLLTKPTPLEKRTQILFTNGYSPQLASKGIQENESEINLKKEFKAVITGFAVSDSRNPNYAQCDFKPVNEHIQVPHGHYLFIRVEYDFPDKYGGQVWTRTEKSVPGMGSNPSGFYKGKGIAYGFLTQPAKDSHLDKIVVRTNSSPRIGNGKSWIISTQDVDIDMEGRK